MKTIRHGIRKIITAILVVGVVVLSGCSTITPLIKKNNLDIHTQMSETIWLDPGAGTSVYLQVKNTSDKNMEFLSSKISNALRSRGYSISIEPNEAHYWLQLNVLRVEEIDSHESKKIPTSNYKVNIIRALLGSTLSKFNSISNNYTIVIDVQIAEKTTATVLTERMVTLQQGTGTETQKSTKTGNKNKYQTRVTSSIYATSLTFEEAKPILEDQITKAVANIF